MRRTCIEDLKPLTAQLTSERLCRGAEARLHRRIGGEAGHRLVGNHPGDVDHEAFPEVRYRRSDHPQRSDEIRSNEFIQSRIIKFLERSERHHTRSVHNAIEATESIDRGAHHVVGVVGLAEVELHGWDVRTELTCSFAQTGSVATCQHHESAARAEFACDPAAQCSRTTEYQGAGTGEVSCLHPPLIVRVIVLAKRFPRRTSNGNQRTAVVVQDPVAERIALVLGAGGAYGWVFHAGVLHGIERALKTRANDAELIVGTSAGSAIGAAIRAGVEPQDLTDVVGRPPSEEDRARMRNELRNARKSLAPFAPRLVQHARNQDRAGMLGIAGLLPAGVFPTTWLARFPGMENHTQWPNGLWIPAVSATTGDVVVFGRDRHDVDVHRAAQASSAVPGMFQPQIVDEIPYIDGGVVSPTHADLTAEIEPDLVIISSPMTRPGRRLTSGHARKRLAEEIETLEGTRARVVVVEPDAATGRLADGFPRSSGSNASRIFESAADLAVRSMDAAPMRQPAHL